MALKGCAACLKYVVLIFNLLFWLAGIGILAVAIWLRVDYAQFAQAHPDLETYNTGTYIVMAAGSLMTLVGFLGCFGAYREIPCMLGTFFVLLLFIFIAEIGAGIWAYLNKDGLETVLVNTLTTTIKHYPDDIVQKEAVDLMQREFKCCGAKGPGDWANSKYGVGETASNILTNMRELGSAISNVTPFKVPESCCRDDVTESVCKNNLRHLGVVSAWTNTIYTTGCSKALRDHLENGLDVVAGIGIGIAVIELLGMIMSMVLCCAIFRKENYKP